MVDTVSVVDVVECRVDVVVLEGSVARVERGGGGGGGG